MSSLSQPMSSLSQEEVLKIGHLARLSLRPDKLAEYASRLSDILELASQMATVDTDSVQPMAHPLDAIQPLREDIVTESNQRDAFQALAALVEAGLYLVPQVIE